MAVGALLAALALAHFGLPGIPCLFRHAFGVPCMTCGMTRSLGAFWQGDFAGAVRYHPLGPLVFAALAAVALWCAAYAAMPGRRPLLQRLAAPFRDARTGWIAAALLIGVWLIRVGYVWTKGVRFWW